MPIYTERITTKNKTNNQIITMIIKDHNLCLESVIIQIILLEINK